MATGWTGKLLRVDLTAGTVKSDSSEAYKDYLGGIGFGYKIVAEEIEDLQKTGAFDPENVLVFAPGPLSGTAAPGNSVTTVTGLCPINPYHSVAHDKMEGNFGAALKLSGYDAVVITGESPAPVWLKIDGEDVSLENAQYIWGTGTKNATAQIAAVLGADATVASIGIAGEHLISIASIVNSVCHSVDSFGAVMGKKKLKAIGVRSRGGVALADAGAHMETCDLILKEMIGAAGGAVVPATSQSFSDYANADSRWTARPDLFWGAALPDPIETGECPPGDVKRIGYRSMESVYDLGPYAERFTVRMGGCFSCPINCISNLKVPALEDYGLQPYVCGLPRHFRQGKEMMPTGTAGDNGDFFASLVSTSLADDYGIGTLGGALSGCFTYAYHEGILKRVLSDAEYQTFLWDKLDAKDPVFLREVYRKIAFNEGEFARIGDGVYAVASRWGFGDKFWNSPAIATWSKLGFTGEGILQGGAQAAAIFHTMHNMMPGRSPIQNLLASGLPYDKQEAALESINAVGAVGALDKGDTVTARNHTKIRLARWALIRGALLQSLTLCDQIWPMLLSPAKDRDYKGDSALEATLLSGATGQKYTEDDLELIGERIVTMARAITTLSMGSKDMAIDHDTLSEWVYTVDEQNPTAPRLDRDDMKAAFAAFYKIMGWDESTGIPTKDTLERLGLGDIAKRLETSTGDAAANAPVNG